MWLLIPTVVMVALLDLYVLDRRIEGCEGGESDAGTMVKSTTGTTAQHLGREITSGKEGNSCTPEKIAATGDSPDRTLETAESSQPMNESPDSGVLGPSSVAPERAFAAENPMPRAVVDEYSLRKESPAVILAEHRSPDQPLPQRILLERFDEPSPLLVRGAYEEARDEGGEQPFDESSVDSWEPCTASYQPQHHETRQSHSSPDRVLAAAERLEDLLVLRASMSELSNLYAETRGLSHDLKKRRNSAAITIQRAFHAYQVAKAERLMEEVRLQWQREKEAAKRMQALWRGALERLNRGKASVVVQRFVRGSLSRRVFARQTHAAIKLQSSLRKCSCEKDLRQKFGAIICIQKAWLSSLETKRRVEGSIVIQRHYRGYQIRQDYVQLVSLLVLLQGWSRGRLGRKSYLRQQQAAMTIQRKCSQFLESQHRGRACPIIQKHARGYLCRKYFRLLINRVIQLQSGVRGYLERTRLGQKRAAARRIQSAWSEALAMKCRVTACKKIQLTYRGYHARIQFSRAVVSAIRLQASVRTWQCQSELGRKLKEKQESMDRAATKIQSMARGALQSTSYGRFVRAVTAIQSLARMHVERRNYHQKQSAAIYIQSMHRGGRDRTAATKRYASILVIQLFLSRMRGSHHLMDRGMIMLENTAATKIQANARAKMGKEAFLRQKRAAVQIQSLCRRKVRHQTTFDSTESPKASPSFYNAETPPRRGSYLPNQKELRREKVNQKRSQLTSEPTPKSKIISLRDPFARHSRKHAAVVRLRNAGRSHLQRRQRRKNDMMMKDVSIHDQLAATTIQAIARGFLARKRCGALQHPLTLWSVTDLNAALSRNLLDNDSDVECSDGSSCPLSSMLDLDAPTERRAKLSVLRAFGELSAKRHSAAATLQRAYLRYRNTKRIAGQEIHEAAE